MKKAAIIFFLVIVSLQKIYAQNPPNWTSKQLMEPSELAGKIKSGKDVPTIYCVGPGALIPNSIDIGMTKDGANIDKLKKSLAAVSKKSEIVIYCGCCPFEHCPNVRPAIDVLKQMGFTNYKLLDLPHNIRTDWMEKGYPTTKG